VLDRKGKALYEGGRKPRGRAKEFTQKPLGEWGYVLKSYQDMSGGPARKRTKSGKG